MKVRTRSLRKENAMLYSISSSPIPNIDIVLMFILLIPVSVIGTYMVTKIFEKLTGKNNAPRAWRTEKRWIR